MNDNNTPSPYGVILFVAALFAFVFSVISAVSSSLLFRAIAVLVCVILIAMMDSMINKREQTKSNRKANLSTLPATIQTIPNNPAKATTIQFTETRHSGKFIELSDGSVYAVKTKLDYISNGSEVRVIYNRSGLDISSINAKYGQ